MGMRLRGTLLLCVLGLTLTSLVAAVIGRSVPTAAAAASQSGTTSLTAPIIQPGTAPTSPTGAKLAGQITFKPALKGRPVTVQRATAGGAWETVANAKENGAGVVTFTATPFTAGGAPYVFRGVAAKYNGTASFTSSSQSAATWVPTFTDQFNGSTLPAAWEDRVTSSSQRTCSSEGDPRARSVGGGTLQVKVLLDPDKVGQTCKTTSGNFKYYLNGSVSTTHSFTQTYGTFAARIKMQQNRGQHGSFWLQPLAGGHVEGDPAASGAEIDVAEFFGKKFQYGGLQSYVYNYSNLNPDGTPVKIGSHSDKATSMLPAGDTWWTSYHVFSVEWSAKGYIFRVDGREHFRTSLGVSGIPEYMILSLLTSDWELAAAKRLGITPGGTLYVDWVRAWKR